ncbi:helix-turn-helix domain-containing protein [Pseudochelatococcus sp. G4_1912]|uniref:helix-turn-helix domain-containing protein n=1 Tax=Pseudochelatococcus sp. G4_1912 TaxID=3114288 RepID=UPI0039C61A07
MRRDYAIDLMQRTNCPLKQTAHIASFRNEKSFSRAFKQWEGSAPSDFRKR